MALFWFFKNSRGQLLGTAGLAQLTVIRPEARCGYQQAYFPDKQFTQTASVWRVFIQPQARGAGLGRKINAELEKVATDKGYTALYLHTTDPLNRAPQKAYGFWEKQGYKKAGEQNDEYGHTVHMRKDLVNPDTTDKIETKTSSQPSSPAFEPRRVWG